MPDNAELCQPLDERRWKVQRLGCWWQVVGGHWFDAEVKNGPVIEVMPVAEHEALIAEHEALRDAALAVVCAHVSADRGTLLGSLERLRTLTPETEQRTDA